MKVAVYPGSFDPITYGHLDIIQRGAKVFDKIIVATLVNSAKNPLFSTDERTSMVRKAVSGIQDCEIEVDHFDGLLVDYVKKRQANVILRGLRAISDFEYELQIASVNRIISDEVETLFFMSNNKHSFISSSMVKEIARYGAETKELVPDFVAQMLREKFGHTKTR
ncbi:Phosphopantetheine adenylyltransferase [Thermoactinomyces sp. DSM 45891]|uniref:Phosphopantetheine adenylyltransferase n=1 Tax=Baia soyae TaxID=1544746 RepID=A0A4R2S4E4_9BACL|nr:MULTISPECIES: pantetheine-phosphate adenylyltransferase [Thermoactinomycetaceae]TCP70652.1 phosphopantetheine adenylyltransferase [Baia soyae]SFX05827.1 Phosphopantetheine adenylyltransferase [Thermoactinomyces sp. DSM 45891]